MVLAALAIRGQRSAHSLATGPCDSGPLHLSLGVHDDTSVVFEVDVLAILPAESLPLTDNYRWHHLLTKAGGSLLNGGHDKITGGGSWKSVETSADALD